MFCRHFDEVDASLDTMNVERIAQMVQNQSKDTQFIVVSHRKPMIESANSIAFCVNNSLNADNSLYSLSSSFSCVFIKSFIIFSSLSTSNSLFKFL